MTRLSPPTLFFPSGAAFPVLPTSPGRREIPAPDSRTYSETICVLQTLTALAKLKQPSELGAAAALSLEGGTKGPEPPEPPCAVNSAHLRGTRTH